MWMVCSGGGRCVVCWGGFGRCARPVFAIVVRCWPCPVLSAPFRRIWAARGWFYLTAFPRVLARPMARLLGRDGYPSGTLVTTGRSFVPRWIVGGSGARKLAGIDHLADRTPAVRWVLLGDDGGHDPQVFVDFACRRPDRVAVIGLRQVFDVDRAKIDLSCSGPGCCRCGGGRGTERRGAVAVGASGPRDRAAP